MKKEKEQGKLFFRDIVGDINRITTERRMFGVDICKLLVSSVVGSVGCCF